MATETSMNHAGWRRNVATNLQGLIHRELGEGTTEDELASAVGVSVQTIENILAAKLPQDPAIWETFATYFHMDADFLRSGGVERMAGELSREAHGFHDGTV